jgi:protein TonB
MESSSNSISNELRRFYMLIHSFNKINCMEPNDMLRSNPLDILFENRNNSYGAYPLRKFYAQRLYISMGVTISVVVLSSFLYLNFRDLPVYTRVIDIPDPHIGTVVFPPKVNLTIPPPVKPSAPRPPVSTITNTLLLIVPDKKVTQTIAAIDELKGAAIGIKTLAGGTDNGPSDHRNAQPGTATSANAPVESKPEVLRIAEVMPEFPGGIEALKRFLLKNLRMPETNLDAGSTVKVIAQFVVDADGKVRDIEIIQAAEAVYNIEVKRVILKMPDWKPGSQNHRNVAVYFNLPINFVVGD